MTRPRSEAPEYRLPRSPLRVERLEDRTAPAGLLTVGLGAGGAPQVRAFDALTRTETLSVAAFDPAFAGGVRVAAGDVTGDGSPDVVAGAGPGGGAVVKVFDGTTGAEVFSTLAFEPGFTGGVFVAAADLDRDGFADVVVTPDQGGGPRVRVLAGRGGGVMADFFGIEDPDFRGGARAAAGDVDGDGTPDLLVAAGFGGGPRLAAFDGQTLVAPQPVKLFADFFVFEDTLRNGVFVAAGDVNGDGFAEVVAGGGPGGGPRVLALSGKGLTQGGQQVQAANFFGGDPANRGGVRVAAGDVDGDAFADLVIGSGDGAEARVTGYAGSTITADGTPPELFAFDATDAPLLGGVFVGLSAPPTLAVPPPPPPVAPTVTLSSPAPGHSNLAAIPVTATFSEPVVGFTAEDLVLGNATAANFAGSGAVYTFDLVASGQGAVIAAVPAGAAAAGSGLGNLPADPLLRTVDTIAPFVLSVAPITEGTLSRSFIDAVDVTFSEPLTAGSFDAGDLTVPGPAGGNLATAAVTVTQTGPTTYRVAGLYGLGVSDYGKWFTPLTTQAASSAALTVAASGVSDPVGNAGVGTGNAAWDLGDISLRDLYVFRSPANANNTVLVLTLSAFAGSGATNAAAALFPALTYRLNADTTGDGVRDVTYEVTFGTPDAVGSQAVTLTRAAGGSTTVAAEGQTGQNLPVAGGGKFRAAAQDDPFFFDRGAFGDLFADGVGTFPRPVMTARNFHGPNGNVMAMVLEVPSTAAVAPNNSVVGVWGTALSGAAQLDQVGRPLTLELLVPPVPRNAAVTPAAEQQIADLLTGTPDGDPARHRAEAAAALQSFYGRTLADATAIANLWFPDMMLFQVGNPNGFGTFVASGTGQGGFFAGTLLGNGRRPRDDAPDFLLTVFTNGAITTDNVADDNGTRITDGNMGTVAAFPYVGAPTLPLDGPGTGPNL